MHWFFEYPWGPALTWVVMFVVLAVFAVSFWTIRKQIWSIHGLSVIGLRLLALAIVLFLLLQPQTKEVKETVLQSYAGVLIDTSKSMSIKDAGSVKNRFDIARDILTDRGGGLVARLQEKGKVRLFQFSTTLEEMPLDGLAELDKAIGDSTAIGSGVADAVERFGAEDLTSLVVLTDGQDNAGQSPVEVARSLEVPLFVVGIGERMEDQEREEKDYAIENVVADRRVMVGRKTDVEISVTSMGFPNRQVPIQLYLDNRLVGSTVVSLGPKRPKAQGIIAYTPAVPGRYVCTVKAPVEKGELDDQNNERMFTVQVIDPINRVLYLEDSPRWESKFLNRVFNGNRNISLLSHLKISAGTTLLLGGLNAGSGGKPPLGEGELDEFKIVVIGDVTRDFFAADELERIAKFVENGGSLVLLGGKNSFGINGFGGTALARVLPAEPTAADQYVEAVRAVTVTPEGAAHPIFQNIQIDWSLAPELNTLVTTGRMRAGATVLLATAAEQSPVVAVQRYGQGKSAVVLTDSTWRWKLGQAGEQLPLDLHEVFWGSVIEWLLPRKVETRQAKAVELMTDKDEYELNQQVHLIVSVTDPGTGAANDALVRCEVQTPDRKMITLQAQLGDISAYSTSLTEGYITSFTPHKSGKYTVTAIAEKDAEELGREQVSMIVGDPALEFRKTDINEELLKEIAAKSGGRYYRPESAGMIIDDIVYREKTVEKTEKEEVWNEWWVLVTFVALISSEWIVRKKRELA